MPKPTPLPPLERLQEVFRADEAGRLYWKKKAARNTVVGKEITTKGAHGYIKVQLDGKKYLGHRIVWFLVYGKDPGEMQVDHINGDKIDNRPSNLRLCNGTQNQLNRKIRSDNKSGVKGVGLRSRGSKAKPWRARYKKKHLGRFATKEEAANALVVAVEHCNDKAFYLFSVAG